MPTDRRPLRLAYADPPYPGKAHLYPENAEVDHVALIARLSEYDGWALSTDETNLAYVLSLCPPKTRVLAWCRVNAPPLLPYPLASWEPVLLWPARKRDVEAVRSFYVGAIPLGSKRKRLAGEKPPGFCEWVLRAMGAADCDTLDDLFPGSGVMGEAFNSLRSQPRLFPLQRHGALRGLRKIADPLPGMPPPASPHYVRDE